MINDIYEAGFDENLTRSTSIEEKYSYEEDKAAQNIEFKNLQIYQEGTAIVNDYSFNGFNHNEGSVRVSHNLGYIPVFEVFVKTGGQYSPLYYSEFYAVPGTSATKIYSKARANKAELIINYAVSSIETFSTPVEFKYFIYRDKIE